MKFLIRCECSHDYEQIRHIHRQAFGRADEANLVDALRKNGNFEKKLSLICEADGHLVGHILFFPIMIRGDEKSHRSLALAPMAVLPEYQRKGIGSALVKWGLNKAKEMGFGSVIVLGHPEYYPKFGFLPAQQFHIRPPRTEWEKSFFAIELKEGALRGVRGFVEYPKEFGI